MSLMSQFTSFISHFQTVAPFIAWARPPQWCDTGAFAAEKSPARQDCRNKLMAFDVKFLILHSDIF